jgi:OmpA-OmpF porin, OOP family
MVGRSTRASYIRIAGAIAVLALIESSSLPAGAAEPLSGWYISGVAGPNIMQEEAITNVGRGTTNNLNAQFDVGSMGVLGGGYGFGNGFRTEFRFNYRYNGLSSISGPLGNTMSFGNYNSGGSEQKYGPMPTLYYDLSDVSPNYVPYVGVGAGYQFVREKHSIGTFSANSTKGDFATQAVIGAAFPIDSTPELSITADYRFLVVTGNNRTYGGIKPGNEFNHAITIGGRYAFGAPPPLPPPAPVAMPLPAPARSYLVFFDWDKADLTDRARQIVSVAAANSIKVQYTRIDVNGYTDTIRQPKVQPGPVSAARPGGRSGIG